HAEVVDDEQGHGSQRLQTFFAGAVEGSVGDFFEQGVGFAVEDAIPLLDDRLADGLGQVAFAAAGRTEKKGVLMPGDKSTRSQIKDQAAIHLFVEVEIEVVEGPERV